MDKRKRKNEELKLVYRDIEANRDAHLRRVQEWIQQPSVSNTGEGIDDSAELTRRYLEKLGCERAEVVDVGETKWGRGNPVVYGEYDAGQDKTLLLYFMYDVMPVQDEAQWVSPPWEGALVKMAPYEKVLIGRGAVNSKGPGMAMLNALQSIKNTTGNLPVNLKLIAEGDEERMSIGLHKFVNDRKAELRDADAVSGFGWQREDGTAWPLSGSEGCVYVELETSGESWGRGPQMNVHGLFKRVLDSPAWRHIKMLSTLVSEDGNEVLVKGWNDGIEGPKGELKELKAVERYADPGSIKRALKAPKLMKGAETKRDFLIKSLYSSTLNLDGIWGGLTEPGTAGAVLPSKVTSKHDIRYVPHQDGEGLVKKLRRHLDSHGYPDVKISVIGDVKWTRCRYDTPIAEALFRTYREFGVKYVKLPTFGMVGLGPYWPAYLFARDPLKLDVCMGGVGHGGRFHAANEYLVIEPGTAPVKGFVDSEKAAASLVYNFAGG